VEVRFQMKVDFLKYLGFEHNTTTIYMYLNACSGISIQEYFLGVFNSEPHLDREAQSAYNTIYKVSKPKCVLTIQALLSIRISEPKVYLVVSRYGSERLTPLDPCVRSEIM
jgi:hypothetical protein